MFWDIYPWICQTNYLRLSIRDYGFNANRNLPMFKNFPQQMPCHFPKLKTKQHIPAVISTYIYFVCNFPSCEQISIVMSFWYVNRLLRMSLTMENYVKYIYISICLDIDRAIRKFNWSNSSASISVSRLRSSVCLFSLRTDRQRGFREA